MWLGGSEGLGIINLLRRLGYETNEMCEDILLRRNGTFLLDGQILTE